MEKLHWTAVIVAAVFALCTVSSFAQITPYVVTNDESFNNSATFW